MQIIIKTTPEELLRARQWWQNLELQWKTAYNEAVFQKGPVIEPPKDDEMMMLLLRADALRFAGPLAIQPNVSIVLTNLSGLIPLYHLTYLSVTNMRFPHIRELARFTRMRNLFLYDNRIESLEGIENMPHLEELYVQNNRIKDLSPIKGLTNLNTLYASRNLIKTLNGLTTKHAAKMKRCYVLPNEDLPDKEIIRVQNRLGILCRQG